MPIYEYKCENGHVFETMQRMADEPLTECEVCGAPVQRVFHPVAVHFKGSGFYTTDYGSQKSPAGADGGGSGSSSGDSGDSGSSSEKSGAKESGGSGSGGSDSGGSDSKDSGGSGSGGKAKAGTGD
jgi:putative FmdB family regulatory protein